MGNGVRKCSSSNSIRRYSGRNSSNDSCTNVHEVEKSRKLGHDVGNKEILHQLDLNMVQRQLIYDSWQNVDDKLDFVKYAFELIFKSRPLLKTPFRMNGHDAAADLFKSCSHFYDHVVRFDKFLTLIVENLIKDDRDDVTVVNSSRQLGRDHCKLNVPTNYYNRLNFDLFVSSLVKSLEREQIRLGDEYPLTKMTKNILETWTSFLNQISEVMLTSYLEFDAKLKS